MFKKVGYSAAQITPLSKEAVLADPVIVERMTKLAHDIKGIAPRSDDFLYFSIIFLKAAESALIDDAGNLKKVGNEKAWGYFDENWKWHGNVKAHKNNNCFVAGTKILMSDCSTKNIEDVVAGDVVITHTGESKKVLTTTKTKHVGELLTLNVRNKESISCTPEHPFYSVQHKHKALQLKKDSAAGNISFSFNEASSLRKGSFLTSPIMKDIVHSEITPGLARLFGIFAAEGSYTKKYGRMQGLLFTIGHKEELQAALIKNLAESEFPGCSVRKNYSKQNSTINITVTGKGQNIAQIFYDNIGEYSHQKKLSPEIVFGSDVIKRQFLIGWLDGDGCLTQYNKIIGITTSPHLAYQAHMMLNSLHISSSLKSSSWCKSIIAPTNGKTYLARKHYRLDIHGRGFEKLGLDTDSVKYKGLFDLALPSKDFDMFADNHSVHSISSIEKSYFNGTVYNFQVEDDNSYVANGLVVHNCDIFPELELKKAHMNWVGKPLCKDHESSSVDGIRGIILDTYYDDKMKQVVGLCALDRVNYADLAKKVETGIVRYGSMGTAVETSVCSDCLNFAKTAEQYCSHVKNRTCHGEINVGLKPIEYSLVVQPAEPGAILLRCIASLQDYKKEFMNYGVEDFNEMLGKLSLEQAQHLNTIVKTACGDGDSCSASDRKKIITSFLKTAKLIDPITVSEPKSISMPRVTPTTENTELTSNKNTIPAWQVSNTKQDVQGTQDYTVTPGNTSAYQAATPDSKERGNVFVDDSDIIGKNLHDSNVDASRSGNNANINKQSRSLISTIMEDIMTESELKKRAELRRKLAYHQGGSDKGVEPSGFKAKPFSFNEDKHMKQTKTMGPVTGEFPGDMKTKEKLSRAELEERQIKRLAYFQGGAPKGVEPVGYKSKPFSHNEDKFMKQTKTMGPVTGEFPGDVKIKEKQKRAAYNGPALSTKLSWPKTAVGTINKSAALFEVFAGDKKVIAASGHEIFGNEINQNWDFFTSKEYGQEVCRQIRTAGIAHVAGLLKGAQAVDPMSAVPAPVGGAMGAPPAAPPAPPMPDMPMGDEGSAPEMGEKEQSPKEQVEGALTEMESKIDEARKALGDLGGESGDVNITVDKDGAEESGADEGSLKLSHNVASQLKTVLAEMNESADELAMISETYAGASRLSKTNREDLDKIATASLREASSLLGKSGTLVKMASALSKQLTKVAQVAYSENAADDDAADEDDASDLMKEDEADDEAVDEADDEGVAKLMAHAMIMRRNRREQLVVEAAKKMDPKAKAKMEADKAKAKREKEKTKAEEDEAKDKMKAKAEKEKARAKAEAEAEKEKAAKKNKTAALRDMVDSAFTAKKEESDKDSYKIKLRRAYDVAIEMQKKGLIAISKTALDRQVDDIMEFDDKAFEAIKRTVANARSVSTVKTASDLGGVNVGSVDAPEGRPAKSTSELLTLLWK